MDRFEFETETDLSETDLVWTDLVLTGRTS